MAHPIGSVFSLYYLFISLPLLILLSLFVIGLTFSLARRRHSPLHLRLSLPPLSRVHYFKPTSTSFAYFIRLFFY